MMPQTQEHTDVESVVRAHAGWVCSCARRRVGDDAMASDVTQAVFILFWRERGRLGKEVKLTGWLYRAVRYCAANALRLKRIRERHEMEAAMIGMRSQPAGEAQWREISPELEQAVDRLRESYRAAVLLRFYRQMSFAEVGQCLGISEAAAQKRVERAVEKLRGMLQKQGVSGTSAGLSAVLVGNVVQEVPARVVEGVMSAIGAGGGSAVAGGIAKGAAMVMAMAKVKVAAVVVGAVIAVSGLLIAQVVSATKVAGDRQSAAASRPVGPKLVLANPAEAKTLHAHTTPLVQEGQAGGPKAIDAWYARDKGVAFVEQYSDRTTVFLDDGVNTWRYRVGRPVIGRSVTDKTLERKLGRLGEELSKLADLDPVRDSAGDRLIAGVQCRSYKLAQVNDLTITQMWIDEANRLRAYDSPVSHVEISYDEEPPAALFSTAWPMDAMVIDADAFLAEQFPVETAISTKEAAGLVFAVHECKAIDRGCYLVICSTRPAKGMDKTLGKNKGYMGGVTIRSAMEGNGEHGSLGYEPLEIANLQNTYGWLHVRWLVMTPGPAIPELHGALSFAAVASAANELEAWRKAKGLEVREEFVVQLDGQKVTSTATDFARMAWEDGERLWPAVDGTLWMLEPGKNGYGVQKPCRPGQVSQAEYERNVQQRIDHALNPQSPSPFPMK